jgi:hypothetical protein
MCGGVVLTVTNKTLRVSATVPDARPEPTAGRHRGRPFHSVFNWPPPRSHETGYHFVIQRPE